MQNCAAICDDIYMTSTRIYSEVTIKSRKQREEENVKPIVLQLPDVFLTDDKEHVEIKVTLNPIL
jgi:hypothetical protein